MTSRTFSTGTAILTPARSSCNSMATRESRPAQPRFMASVNSSSARLAMRMGTPNSRPTAVASETSLCASLSAKDGGSKVPGRN